MAADDDSRVSARRPSAHVLLAAQVRYQLRLLIRSPIASFATLVVPLMVLLAVNLLFSSSRLHTRGDIRFAQFFTPAMVAFAVISVCYMSVITSTTTAREEGILKRIRSSPLPPWVYMTGRIISAGLVAAVATVAVIAVGAGIYDFEIVWSAIPAALLTFAVAIFSFCALGLAVSVLVPTADAALPIAWGTALPLCFVSDIFQPIDTAPHWLRDAASFFPLRPFADDLQTLFNPVTGSVAIDWSHLAVLGAWGVIAGAFALVAFRWEPGGQSRGGRAAPRGSATFGVDRARELLEARVGEGPRPQKPRPRPGKPERHQGRPRRRPSARGRG